MNDMSETKPLTQVWRENSKASETAIEDVTWEACAEELDEFAATHLAEQTEPSEELVEFSYRRHRCGDGRCVPYNLCDVCQIRAEMIMEAVNADRKRIRALLCGNS